MVGVTGFEPATPASRTQCSGQAELHPDLPLKWPDLDQSELIASIEVLCELARERVVAGFHHMTWRTNSRTISTMLLTSQAVQGRIQGPMKLSMKRFVSAIAGLLALGWSALAFAQATTITTSCPTSFTCAFSAAETMSLVTPKPNTPGQPDVYAGYMVFDGSSNVTLTGLQNLNGTVGQIGSGSPPVLSSSTPCAAGANGQPANITFTDNSVISFVTDSGGAELQFILSQDKNSTTKTASNSVRVGVCRKQ